jgi:hypothetical protein
MLFPQSPEPIKNAAPIDQMAGLTNTQIETLKAHWIISIQEFLALTEIPSTRKNLEQLLGIDGKTLDKLTRAARKQLSLMRDGSEALMETLAEIEYSSGVIMPPLRFREITYESLPLETVFPPAISYSDELPPTRNQGDRGTCVAHAAAAAREFLEIRRRRRNREDVDPRDIDLSEQFIYWWCKKADGLPDVSGTYPYLGMKCLLEMGAAREITWPYNPNPTPNNEGQGPPPEEALSEASRYRIQRIIHLRPDDIVSMKAALLQGKPVLITIPMFDSWYRSSTTRQYGKINLPLPEEKEVGAHAMILIGYVDDENTPGGGYFILRNSWKPWGMQNPLGRGLASIPYDFLRKHNTLADTGELPITADIYIRDNPEDDGDAPSRGLTFNSPDIWVRHRQDGLARHQKPDPDAENWLYIRVWNKGPETATRVRAETFIAPVSPSIWPDMWQPLGEIEFPNIAAGENAIAALPWQPEHRGQRRFLVRLSSVEDPAQHQWAVRYDNNIAQKNLVQVSLKPGQSTTITFPIYGLPKELTLRHIRVDRSDFRRGRIGLEISRGQFYREQSFETEDQVLKAFAGQATETRTASLTITMDKRATAEDGGSIVISQQYSTVLIGRMMIEVQVID